jgi:methyl-accepting chemotaxis protein
MTDKEILNRITELLPDPSGVDEARQKLQARLDRSAEIASAIAEIASALQVLSRTSLRAAEYADRINWFASGITLMTEMSSQWLEVNNAHIQMMVSEAREIVRGVTGGVK